MIAGPTAADSLEVLVDGTGLSDPDEDRFLEHSTGKNTMRQFSLTEVADGLVFDLNGEHTLESLQIWNYNESGYTSRGIAQADVSVWTPEDGWKTILKHAKLTEAEGTDDYDEPTVLSFDPVRAQKVRLEKLTPFADEGFIGLSAIRFYEPATDEPCNPQPVYDAKLPCVGRLMLAWVPGKDAIAHDVYAAPEGQELTLLGRIAQTRASLAGLAGGRRYIWRVDEVQKDGTITPGPEWAFDMNEGRCVGQWSFSENEGKIASDTSGCGNNGKLKGDPSWTAGKSGTAIDFDGKAGNIGVSVSDTLNFGAGDYTISAWIYPRSVSDWRGIVTKVRDDNHKEYAFSLHDGALTLEVEVNGNNGREATAPVIATDRWQHVAVVFDSTAKDAVFYVDGQPQEKVADTIDALPAYFNDNLSIGRFGGMYDSRYFDGIIDEINLFNCVLSPQQVAALAHSRPVEWSDADTSPALTLVGAELLDRQADLKTVAQAQSGQGQETPSEPKRSNLLPVLIIIGVFMVVAVILRSRKSAA